MIRLESINKTAMSIYYLTSSRFPQIEAIYTFTSRFNSSTRLSTRLGW